MKKDRAGAPPPRNWIVRRRVLRASRPQLAAIVPSLFALLAAALMLTGDAAAQEAEAALGSPLNVARVVLTLAPGESAPRLKEQDGRALYVATKVRRRGLLLDRGGSAEYRFLFAGDQPLTLTWPAPRPRMIVAPETPRPRVAERLFEDWWSEFLDQTQTRLKEASQPPVADHYLLAMLASRFGQTLPVKRKAKREEDRPLRTIELLAGAEKLRATMLRDALLEPRDEPGELAPAPSPALWAPLPGLPVSQDVEIEPLAKHTPPECLYLRFGRFSNFLWFTHFIREQGGDVGAMISPRGFTRDMTERFERQFAIRYSILADLLGDQVVEDLALIGTDLYFEDGAAMGVLLQGKNKLLLDAALNRERSAALSREKKRGCTQQTVMIDGHATDLLSTPDNQVRSYLAVHKDMRLVTNSRRLAERFWAVADGALALGDLNEFKHARTRMPATPDDTLFAYFSSHFFHNLVSPQYQIELQRRLRAVVDFQLLELATIAGRREGLGEDEATLIRHGLLPPDWGQRPDGSRLLRTQQGELVDSLRGSRGSMLPIPDVPVRDVTPQERGEFVALANFYQEKWLNMDPLMATVKRFSVDGKREHERLVVDAQISPFVERKYARWLGLLGEPTTDRVKAPENAVIRGQASLRGGLLSPTVPAHQLFIGIVDRPPRVDDLTLDGVLDTLRTMQAIPGYLGAWPRPGFLDMFPFAPEFSEDQAGYSRLPFRLWRWRGGDISLLSFDRELLEKVQPILELEQSEAPTQAWLRVADLSSTKLAPWIRGLHYRQAVAMSRGNAQLLTTLTETLGAKPSEAQATAGRLVDGTLRCPLGHEYEVEDEETACGTFAWSVDGFAETPPDDFESPLLRWFRGGAVMLNSDSSRLMLHAEIDVRRSRNSTDPAGFALPLLKGLPSLFGNGAKAAADAAKKPPETEQNSPPPKAP